MGGVPVKAVDMHEAETHLSRLVDEAAAGQEIIIAKSGRPRCAAGRHRKGSALRPRRVFGRMKGQDHGYADDFDDPLPGRSPRICSRNAPVFPDE